MNWITIQKFIKSIEARLKDQVINTIKSPDFYIRFLASFILILSGVILFTDKLTSFSFKNNYGFEDSQTFVWVLCQSLSPIILCLGGMLRPYKVFYHIPLYLYFIQIYWIFDPSIQFDDLLIHVYATGFCIGVFLFTIIAIVFLKRIRNNNKRMLFNIRKMSTFILFEVRNKYVDSKDKKAFAKDVVDLNKTLK